MNAFTIVLKKCPRIFYLLFCVACALFLSSCGLSEKGAEKLSDTGAKDLQSGNPLTASNAFSQAIALDPQYVPAYLNRAYTRRALHDLSGAIADCNAAIALDASEERAFLMRASCEYILTNYAAASNDFSVVVSLNPDDDQARFYRASIRLVMRDWSGACDDLSNTIQLNPNNAMAYHYRAAAEIKLKDYEKAMKDASTSMDLDSVNADEDYGILADVETKLKNRAQALTDADHAVEAKPCDRTYLMRADTKIDWDDFSGASNDLEIATQLNPTNSKIILCHAIMEQKLRQPGAAIADFNRALAQNLDSYVTPDIHEAMGYLHEDLHQWNLALEEFRTAQAANSPPAGNPLQIFLLQSRLGRTQQAQKELNAYIRSLPPAKEHDWITSIAHFLAGDINETDFLSQATSTAKRPVDIPGQFCDAYYFEGMKDLLAGDKIRAAELFQKCLQTPNDDNNYAFMEAKTELLGLKQP